MSVFHGTAGRFETWWGMAEKGRYANLCIGQRVFLVTGRGLLSPGALHTHAAATANQKTLCHVQIYADRARQKPRLCYINHVPRKDLRIASICT